MQGEEPTPAERAAARDKRRRFVQALQLVFGAVTIVYLTLHAFVTWKAFTTAGVWWALATLVTLGFGDLWWAVDAWRSGDRAVLAVAGGAAVLAFTSWATRGYTNKLLMQLTQAELADFLTDPDSETDRFDDTDKVGAERLGEVRDRARRDDP